MSLSDKEDPSKEKTESVAEDESAKSESSEVFESVPIRKRETKKQKKEKRE